MQLLTDIQTISPSIPVFMLDGITHLVHKMGKVLLSDALSLHDVLFFPSFKFNLLLVNKICLSSNLELHFSSTSCSLQDKLTNQSIAVGKLFGTRATLMGVAIKGAIFITVKMTPQR